MPHWRTSVGGSHPRRHDRPAKNRPGQLTVAPRSIDHRPNWYANRAFSARSRREEPETRKRDASPWSGVWSGSRGRATVRGTVREGRQAMAIAVILDFPGGTLEQYD